MAKVKVSRSLLLLLFLVPGPLASDMVSPSSNDEDWANSPEAYFLTGEERKEWQGLRSRESRQDFIGRYWLKRDPSPGTAPNEFRDLVLSRIKTADARYRIEKTPGSRTSQGFVFIVFGTPARVQERHAASPPPPRRLNPGERDSAVGFIEGTETTHTWIYDRERTPKLLEALGVPTLSVNFVVEPNRHHDELQQPGLVNEYRERLARKTIVNPDLVPAADAPAAAEAAPPPPQPALLPLSAGVRGMLEKAPPQGIVEDEGRPVFGSAVLWGARESPETLTWVFLPGKEMGAEKLTLHALVRAEHGGPETVSGSEAAEPSTVLPTARPGRVVVRSFDLPAGNYSASLAVTAEGERLLASASLTLRVPTLRSDFAVSSMVVAAGITPLGKSADKSFVFGPAEVLPRADASFARTESLWYFVQLANVSDAEKVTQEVRLRRGADTVAARPPAPAELQQLAPGRYAFGYEIPLSGLEPGSYVLYVTVRDSEGHSALRRADFRVIPAAQAPQNPAASR